tara:strand:+ start:4238 stop:5539 length:1302 start_codon:yes stop_codon:yes gene_type:complete
MKYILTLAVFLCSFSVFTQESDDIGKIALHVVLPEEYSPNFENLGPRELKKIKSKIGSITSRNGIAGAGLGNFVIYPVLNIYDEEVLEGGLEHQTIIRAEFSLFIQQVSNGQVYGEATIDLEGFGRDRSKALAKAIQGINIRDRRWKEMIITSKQKIIDYYISRCDDIMVEAEGYSKTRHYDDAIATLMQVPTEVGQCYRQIIDKTVEYYDYKMELECQEKIAAAKVAKAQDNWETAASYMYGILPHFSCYDNAMILLKDIEDHRCAVSLGKAKAAWARGESGANEAAMHLGQVATDSKCAEEANALSAEVRSRLQHLELRDWELQYEKYNRDQKMREDVVKHAIDVSDRNTSMRESDQQHRQDMERTQAENDNKLANREMDYKEGRGADLEEAKLNNIKEIAIAKWKYKAKKAKADGKKTVNYNYYTKKKKK